MDYQNGASYSPTTLSSYLYEGCVRQNQQHPQQRQQQAPHTRPIIAVKDLQLPNFQIVNQIQHLNQAVNRILLDCAIYPIIALDCEWVTKNRIRQPVALLQIATINCTYIIQMKFFDAQSLATLSPVLGNAEIIKAGVGIKMDVDLLQSDYNLKVVKWFDIRHLSLLLGPQVFPPRSLAYITNHMLGIQMDKSLSIRCSKWDKSELSTRQVAYAVFDVFLVINIIVKSTQLYNIIYDHGVFSFQKFNTHFNCKNFLYNIYPYCEQDFIYAV